MSRALTTAIRAKSSFRAMPAGEQRAASQSLE
jgi:hypothetical protein